jgi:Icc-related predicted phosphoesterase
MVNFLCIYAVGWLAAIVAAKRLIENHPRSGYHSFVVLADPQLGMKNQYSDSTDWRKELTMFSLLVKAAVKQRPDFIFIAGDMQNYWPNEKGRTGKVGRNRMALNSPKQSDRYLASGQLGVDQRAAVKRVILYAKLRRVPVYFTAGNHDVGDVPDVNTLTSYAEEWGELWNRFWVKNVLYLQFTSQFYWDHSLSAPNNILDRTAQRKKIEQSKWLLHELNNMPTATKRVVLMTHIPPFMDQDKTEAAGWANWKQRDRNWFLNMLNEKVAKKHVPVLWVCGHFHTNVHKKYTVYGTENDMVVTSSAGSTMWWDGAKGPEGAGSLAPDKAATVASKSVGDAFFQDIILPGNKNYGEGNWGGLILPSRERSGMRVFTMRDDGAFWHEWKTLKSSRFD